MSAAFEATTQVPAGQGVVDTGNPYAAPHADQSTTQRVHGTQNILQVLFSFQGRIRRGDFWAATLVVAAAYCGIELVVAALVGHESDAYAVFMLVMLVPLLWIDLAVTVKRLHDRNRSGRWILIYFIPYIGGIWAFIECGCLRGTVGDNDFGPDPTQRSTHSSVSADAAWLPERITSDR